MGYSVRKATFATMCGVSRPQIERMVKAGKIVLDKNGYVSTSSRINKAYLKAHGVELPGQKKGAAKKKKDQPLAIQKLEADIALKRAMRMTHDQRRLKDLGHLVERSIVTQMFAAFGAEIKLRFLDLPRRISAQLFALARAEGATPMAIEGYLNEEISKALQAAKDRARQISGSDPDSSSNST